MPEKLPNIHPGEILLEEFLKPLGISQNKLAREIKVSPRRVNEIVLGKRAITPETALRLARYFGTSERFWLGLQLDFGPDVVPAVSPPPADSLHRRQPISAAPSTSRFAGRGTHGKIPPG